MNEALVEVIKYVLPLVTAFAGAFFGIKSSVIRLENDVKRLGDEIETLKSNVNESVLEGAREYGVLRERLVAIETRMNDFPSSWTRKAH